MHSEEDRETRTYWSPFSKDDPDDVGHDHKVRKDATKAIKTSVQTQAAIEERDTHNAGQTLVSTNSPMFFSSDGGCDLKVSEIPKAVSIEMYVVPAKIKAPTNQKGWMTRRGQY